MGGCGSSSCMRPPFTYLTLIIEFLALCDLFSRVTLLFLTIKLLQIAPSIVQLYRC